MPVTLPILVVVSGPAGTGKTTLAHRLAAAIRCPAICRDEIKEGMILTAQSAAQPVSAPDREALQVRTLGVFFDVVRILLEQEVTVVAEAAFQDHVWSPRLGPLAELAEIKVVQCHTTPELAWARLESRGDARGAHDDRALLETHGSATRFYESFRRIALDAPSIEVDTTDGYRPSLDTVVEFVTGG
jgi:predicted kinase